jgi:hypothetical protein
MDMFKLTKKFNSIFSIGYKKIEGITTVRFILDSQKNTNLFYSLNIEELRKYKAYLENENKFVEEILNKKEKELKRIRGED